MRNLPKREVADHAGADIGGAVYMVHFLYLKNLYAHYHFFINSFYIGILAAILQSICK